MGGESSKHATSPGAARSRERKRSGLSNALAGGDCRSTTESPRPHASGPSYSNILAHIPAAPVKCTPMPITTAATLDKSLTWISDTEAVLVTEWNRERQETAMAGLRGLNSKPGGTEDSSEAHFAPSTKQNSTTATPSPATAGATTGAVGGGSWDRITKPGPTSFTSSAVNLVPLSCDSTPATTGRSTGLTFRVPATWTHSTSQESRSSSSARSSPKLPADKRGAGGIRKKPLSSSSQTVSSPSSSVVISALPVGVDYYRALQSRWTTPESRAMPPATEEEDLDDSVILEAIVEPEGIVLSPPVPLGYMIDLFVPQWRAEGLYEQADIGTRVPEAPVGCTPSPINLGAARDLTISWLSQAESALVLDWAREQEAKKAARAAKAEKSAALQREQRERQWPSGNIPASQLVAEAGLQAPRLSSSSSSSVDSWSSSVSAGTDDRRREEGFVPLGCDHAPFPFNRSSGVVFELPASNTGSATATAAASDGVTVTLPTVEVPVGMDYYGALQKAWSQLPESPPKLPPLASEADVNISDIDDVLSGDSDYEELNPPVPLGLMISYFAEDWRENGLYDVVQKREEQMSSQTQRK